MNESSDQPGGNGLPGFGYVLSALGIAFLGTVLFLGLKEKFGDKAASPEQAPPALSGTNIVTNSPTP